MFTLFTVRRLRRHLHRLDDVLIPRAAAEVAGEGQADFLLGRVRMLCKSGRERHQEAGRAEAVQIEVIVW